MVEIVEIVEQMLGVSGLRLEQIRAGKNSQVYLVVDEVGSQQWIAKRYFRAAYDTRDRLATEYAAFDYLHHLGVKQVPQTIGKDDEQGIAIYEYISGARAIEQAIDQQDIDQAVAFLVQLKEIADRDDHDFIPASEAYFCPQDVLRNVKERRQRFDAVKDAGDITADFLQFIHEFDAFFNEFEAWLKQQCAATNVDFDQPLEQRYRTLSSSDFGYHNALRCKNGSLAFVDFEYFGWDDPAKTVSDFLWHPAMALNDELKMYFWSKMHDAFPHMKELEQRVKLMYPLFGLKWCLIFLNEFLPKDQERKQFLNSDDDRQVLLKQQLAKAQSFLKTVQRQYKEWPYGCKI